MVYLDHCATTPLDPRVREVMAEVGETIQGNPSSVHGPGREARARLSRARMDVAQRLGVSPPEIVFCGSGSEANNLALKGLAYRSRPTPFHLVIAAFEHDSVLFAARYLAERCEWVRLTEVDPGPDGLIDPAHIDRACAEGASLVSVMTVNNELGTRQPIEAIAEVAHRHGALFHTDAVQALGRESITIPATGSDLFSASAHKIYGPAGVGILYVRKGIDLDALIHGGGHEKGRRAGTENLIEIAAFAEAFSIARERLDEDLRHAEALEETFLDELRAREIRFQINGSPSEKKPGILNVSLEGVSSHDVVIGMDLEGFALSAGSACSSGVIEPSHVLKSMGLEPPRIESAVRISFGRSNHVGDASAAAAALAPLITRLVNEQSVSSPMVP